MLWYVACIQTIVLFFFFAAERIFPARNLPRNNDFFFWWILVSGFSLLWLRLLFVYWSEVPQGPVSMWLGPIYSGFVFFFIYSFFNYWWHRAKHHNRLIWRYTHRFHHCPSKMETALIFFKHPLELLANTLLIAVIAWFFSMPLEAIAVGLLIEGIIETYHHANVATPRRLRWIGHIIQTPEMHLIHHQKGLHRYNYVTFLWDTVFKTARIPEEWTGEQGFDLKNGIKGVFLCQK